MNTNTINAAEITQVYSGAAHKCMCGCKGRYYYPSREVEAAGKARGYALAPDEISDRQVTRIVNLINKHGGKHGDSERKDGSVHVVVGQRIYCAWF